MQSLTVIVNGQRYVLTDTPFILTFEDGTGMAPVQRIERRAAQQHGASDVGFYLEPRNIKFIVDAKPDADNSADALRRLLVKIFRPSRKMITLEWIEDDGQIYCIDGHYVGDMTFSSEMLFGIIQRAAIDFRAADPTFYNPEVQFVSFVPETGGSVGMTFPTNVNAGQLRFPFAAPASISANYQLQYQGTWQTYPTVEIVGPATNAIITNLATGAKLDFTGTTIAAGVSYTVDTRPEHEGVTDSNGSARDDKLTADSDLVGFYLLPDGDIDEGINPIQVQVSSAASTTAVFIRYLNRYVGK